MNFYSNRIIENKIINEKNKIIEKEEEIGNLIYKKINLLI